MHSTDVRGGFSRCPGVALATLTFSVCGGKNFDFFTYFFFFSNIYFNLRNTYYLFLRPPLTDAFFYHVGRFRLAVTIRDYSRST